MENSRTFFLKSQDEKEHYLSDPSIGQGYVRPGQEILDALKEDDGEVVSEFCPWLEKKVYERVERSALSVFSLRFGDTNSNFNKRSEFEILLHSVF